MNNYSFINSRIMQFLDKDDLSENLDINNIQSIWSDIISVEKRDNPFSVDYCKKYYLLTDNQDKQYVLKIYINKPDKIKRFIRYYNSIFKNINKPNIEKYKVFFSRKHNKFIHFILYEYIEDDFNNNQKMEAKAMNLIVEQLFKLHKLPRGSSTNTILNKKDFLDIKVMKNKNLSNENFILLKKARSYLKENIGKYSPLAWCHLDLHPANMVFKKDKIYFIDWDDVKYDFVIFDLAVLCGFLIAQFKGQYRHSVKYLLNKYLKMNKQIEYNNDILFYSTLLIYYEKFKDNRDINIHLDSISHILRGIKL